MVLAAIDRAGRHYAEEREGAPFSVVVVHLGFVHNGWTTRRLRLQLEGLVTQGLVSSAHRKVSDLWGLTDAGRERLMVARKTSGVEELPESPPHRAWRRARAVAAEQIDGFRERAKRGTEEATALLRASRRAFGRVVGDREPSLSWATGNSGGRPTACASGRSPTTQPQTSTITRDPGDEQLDKAAREQLRSLRRHRHDSDPDRSRGTTEAGGFSGHQTRRNRCPWGPSRCC
jgi:hypothetical protein